MIQKVNHVCCYFLICWLDSDLSEMPEISSHDWYSAVVSKQSGKQRRNSCDIHADFHSTHLLQLKRPNGLTVSYGWPIENMHKSERKLCNLHSSLYDLLLSKSKTREEKDLIKPKITQ